jgi:hypothetical protein
MFRIKYTSCLVNVIISQMCSSFVLMHLTFTLKCLYVCSPFTNTICTTLVRFPLLSAPCINLLKNPKINDSKYMNLDVAYLMMLIKYLLALFGIMTHLVNRKILMKNLLEFDDSFHMNFYSTMVKVYAASDVH